ncbi:hypothetical protein, partial [uncultured Thiodictyon sp.]|uniref:hypothetical protein n=1 Tax=uncultured Thiodictyon sp. TaxID=1846217 RepID=UPI0025D8C8D5
LACDREHPDHVRTVLRRAVQGAAIKRGLIGAAAARAVECAFAALCEANLNALETLRAAAEAIPCPSVAAVLTEAAKLQGAIIREVLGQPNHPPS